MVPAKPATTICGLNHSAVDRTKIEVLRPLSAGAILILMPFYYDRYILGLTKSIVSINMFYPISQAKRNG